MFMVFTVLYIFFIGVLLCISLPLVLIISVCIVCTSGIPIIFFQERIGKNGKVFVMCKFRTMFVDAERRQREYKKRNEADGPVFKIHDDPRFTRIGKFLSHTGLDELPQLWNIIRGDMSLFGPRPLPVFEAKKLLSWQKKRQIIKPGIFSPWVLNGYHTKTFTEWMKSDCTYVLDKSVWYDIKLFFRSMGFMMKLFFHETIGRET